MSHAETDKTPVRGGAAPAGRGSGERPLPIAAKVRRNRRALLWVPLCTLPACLLFLVLGEAFCW